MANVDYKRPEFEEDQALRKPCLALMKGLPALLEDAKGAKEWLWAGPGELDTREVEGYKNVSIFQDRMKRLRIRNVYAQALRRVAATPFSEKLVVTGWPGAVMARLDDLDGEGGSIDDLAERAFERKLFAGIHFIRLDMPAEGGLPYWVPTDAEDFTYWDWRIAGGRVYLSQANIELPRERPGPTTDPNDFDAAAGPRRKIVYWSQEVDDPVYFRVYRQVTKSADGAKASTPGFSGGKENLQRSRTSVRSTTAPALAGWEPVEDDWAVLGDGSLKDIPIAPFYTDRIAPYRSPPAFYDQAMDQMDLVRRASELSDLRRRASAPLELFFGGKPPDGTQAGTFDDLGDQMFFHDPTASAAMLAVEPRLIEVLEKGIEEAEAALRVACNEPSMARDRREITATEIGVHANMSHSWIDRSVNSDMGSLTRLLEWTSILMGHATTAQGGKVEPGAPSALPADEQEEEQGNGNE